MNCKFSYIKYKDNLNRSILYCSVTKERCPLVRFCNRLNDYINIDGCTNCRFVSLGEDIKAESKGLKNKVRFERNGKLYIEVNDQVIVLDNPFSEVPRYVNVVKVGDMYVIDTSHYQN
jgi:hypothetical protein